MTPAPRPIGNEWNPPAAVFGGPPTPPPAPPAPDLFVAVSSTGVLGDGQHVMTSPAGDAWTLRDSIETYDGPYRDVCFAPALGLVCAVALGNDVYNSQPGLATQIMTSPDGLTWTRRVAADGENYWSCVEWSPELELFCSLSPGINAGVDGGGTAIRIQSSADGVTWTGHEAPGLAQWRDLCWAAELGLFVAVASNSTGNRVMTSPDGETWTMRVAAEANAWQAVCWSPELGLLVAVSPTGASRVMTSPDGITWTARSAAAANGWLDVIWCAELGLFVAVAVDGVDRVMTSPDGVNWTSRAAAAANAWSALAFDGTTIVAVAQSGAGDRVMTSTDGINWTSRTSAADKGWVAVCWAGS